MTTLARAVAVGDNEVIVNAPTGWTFPRFVKIDSELLPVGGQQYREGTTLVLSSPATAAHDSGATVSDAGRPFNATFLAATTGAGAGGVTVDNTVDAPFAASTLIAAGATESAPDEATLADPTQMVGEEIVLTNPDDRSDGGQFVTFEASDGEVYKLQTSGASTQTLIEGASAQIVRDTGGAVLVVGFTGVIAKGASNDLIATVRATDALGFYGATPVVRPEVPATPTEQDIVDALVLLGLVTQAAP